MHLYLAGRRLADVGMIQRDQASLLALTDDVIETCAIEGEQLNVDSVRSSIARRLGVDIGALAPVYRHVEGVVDMVLDATGNHHTPLTLEMQSLDVIEWLTWFLATLHRAVDQAQRTLDTVLIKTRFWQRWAAPGSAPLNARQMKLVNRLVDGFDGMLTSSEWAAIVKCSLDTALRDITDLQGRGILRKSDSGGRSTSYVLADP